MLFLTRVTKWIGVGLAPRVIDKTLGTQYVLSTENIFNLKADGLLTSQFDYLSGPSSFKAGRSEVHCNSSVPQIQTEFDVVPSSNMVTLSVFPKDSISQPTFSTHFNVRDFGYAWAHNPYPQYSWIVYNKLGLGPTRILANITLNDLVSAYGNYTVNDIQWFVYVDLTEVIDLNKYIRV